MIKHRPLFILLNLFIVIDVLFIFFSVLIKIPSSFRYFTVLSNVSMALIAMFAIYTALKRVSSPILNLLYLIITTSLVLVFLVVALFLSPQFDDYFFLFSGYNFFLHFLNPLLAVISLLLLNHPKYNCKTSFLSLIPPFLYAILYFIFVILRKDWSDFYNFTLGGNDWLSFITLFVILVVTYSISTILVLCCKKLAKPESEKQSSI